MDGWMELANSDVQSYTVAYEYIKHFPENPG